MVLAQAGRKLTNCLQRLNIFAPSRFLASVDPLRQSSTTAASRATAATADEARDAMDLRSGVRAII